MVNYRFKAKDIMQTDVATILGDATIQEAAALMRYEGVRSLLIVPRDQSTDYGIITFSDIVKKVIRKRRNPREVRVDDVATSSVHSIMPDADVQSIAEHFTKHDNGHAPIIDAQGKLLGMVSMTDLVTEVITEPD